MPRLHQLITGSFLCVACATACADPPVALSYAVEVALSGNDKLPVAINNRGDIAFQSPGASGHIGNVSYANGGLVAFTLPDAQNSHVDDLNERGQAVGWSFTCCDTVQHPVLLTNGQVAELDPSNPRFRTAYGINNAGEVAGQFINADGNFRAVVYNGSSYKDLGTLGGFYSEASRINDAGQVVGTAATTGGDAHGFLYSAGVMTDLGVPAGFRRSSASGINEAGQVIGVFGEDNELHAFLYSAGQMIGLAAMGFSSPTAINNLGQIVGRLGTGPGNPFLWQGGTLYQLNSLIDPAPGYLLEDAADINDNGQILARGCKGDHTSCDILLLTPVPEPWTWTMLAAGLALFGLRTRLGTRR